MESPYIPTDPAEHGPGRKEYERFWELVISFASETVGNTEDNANDDGRDYDGPKTGEDLFLSMLDYGVNGRFHCDSPAECSAGQEHVNMHPRK